MKFIATLISISVILLNCKQRDNAANSISERLDTAWLAGIIKNSDSSYTKSYYRTDFVTASYYINKKDSTLCQVMRDSLERVRQIITTKNDIRTFYAQYYTNGHIQAVLPLDKVGKYHGNATVFYQDGTIKSEGKYEHGLYNGEWKNYDETGKLITKEEYDSNGQLIKTTKGN